MSDITKASVVENGDQPWSLAEQTASLNLSSLQAEIRLFAPELGLSNIKVGHEHLPGKMLQVRPASSIVESAAESVALQSDAMTLTESYIRDCDLVADYPPRERFPFRSWIYWRVLPTVERSAVAALEVIVSTQTDLLESHPQVSVTSSLPAVELWRLKSLEKAELKQISLAKPETRHIYPTEGPGCYLWRLSGDRWSYAEMIPPGDFSSTQIRRDAQGLVSVSHQMFGQSLEKGVILRSRVRGILLERGGDAVQAMNWYRHLLRSELPLTA